MDSEPRETPTSTASTASTASTGCMAQSIPCMSARKYPTATAETAHELAMFQPQPPTSPPRSPPDTPNGHVIAGKPLTLAQRKTRASAFNVFRAGPPNAFHPHF